MSETWKPVVGYEGRYEVSDTGRVRSLERRSDHPRSGTIRIPGRELKPTTLNGLGYQVVNLYKDGKPTLTLVHRIVLESFVGECPEGMEACHRDSVAWNNNLSNLRWDTRSGNSKDTVRNGNHPAAKKTHCPRKHPLTGPNLREGSMSKGRRDCKACARERATSAYEMRDFDPLRADERYQDVIRGTTKPRIKQ